MEERREVCTCTNCGNEAEMTITCELVEVQASAGERGQTGKGDAGLFRLWG